MASDAQALKQKAKDHLWMHFSRQQALTDGSIPIIVRGEGHRIWDVEGREYFDGISGLFTVNLGHGRTRLGEAAARQAAELDYFPVWGYAHPRAIELADRLADLAPGELNRVFFTSGGGEAVETAFKLAKQYYKLIGKGTKHKVISRSIAYHGTPHGALSLTGITPYKMPFEPLVPGAIKVPNTNWYRRDENGFVWSGKGVEEERFGRWAADMIEQAILMEGPDTVAAVFLEPVQNGGGCFVPPPGYLARVQDICERHDVIFVADETITAFGRIGDTFAMKKFGVTPDIITCAKGMSSGFAPIGAAIVSEEIYEPFASGTTSFLHGYTFGGHPMTAAVALEALDIYEEERINEHVTENSPIFRAALDRLRDLPIVGDVRGDGYFFGIELVKDQATRETFDDEESERLLRGYLSRALWEAGLYCRSDDRGDPVVQVAPPLTCGPAEFDEIESILRRVLTAAQAHL